MVVGGCSGLWRVDPQLRGTERPVTIVPDIQGPSASPHGQVEQIYLGQVLRCRRGSAKMPQGYLRTCLGAVVVQPLLSGSSVDSFSHPTGEQDPQMLCFGCSIVFHRGQQTFTGLHIVVFAKDASQRCTFPDSVEDADFFTHMLWQSHVSHQSYGRCCGDRLEICVQ